MAAQGISAIPLAGYQFPQIAPLVRHLPMDWCARCLDGPSPAGGAVKCHPSPTTCIRTAAAGRRSLAKRGRRGRGRELGLHAPVNETLTHVLLDLVEGRASIKSWAGQPQRLLDEVNSRRWRLKCRRVEVLQVVRV